MAQVRLVDKAGAAVLVWPTDVAELMASGEYRQEDLVENVPLAAEAPAPTASPMATQELVHQDGTVVSVWPIDARELLASGEYRLASDPSPRRRGRPRRAETQDMMPGPEADEKTTVEEEG